MALAYKLPPPDISAWQPRAHQGQQALIPAINTYESLLMPNLWGGLWGEGSCLEGAAQDSKMVREREQWAEGRGWMGGHGEAKAGTESVLHLWGTWARNEATRSGGPGTEPGTVSKEES